MSWLFGRSKHEDESPAEAAERIGTAACALLHAMAQADGDTAGIEEEAIARAMRERFQLSDDVIASVVASAGDAKVDLYKAATVVRDGWGLDDKRQMVKAIRDVIWADGALEGDEQRLASSVAYLLGLPSGDVQGLLKASD